MIVMTMARTPSLNASSRLVRMAPTIADVRAVVQVHPPVTGIAL